MEDKQGLRLYLERASRAPIRLLATAVLVGAAAGLVGLGFHHLITLVQKLVLGTAEDPVPALQNAPWYYKIILPAIGAAIVAPMIYTWVKETRGHGIPEVMEAVSVHHGKIRGRVAVVKSLAAGITVGTGGSIGSEGPAVQIGAAVGSKVGQLLKLPPESLISLVGCGSAAALAAIYNAPIGGAFFALEIILGNFAAPTFGPIVMASVTGVAVSKLLFGEHPAFFEATGYVLKSVFEIPLYGGLGLLAGFVSLAFTTSVGWMENFFDSSRAHPYLRPVIGGLLLGACLLFAPQVYGHGFFSIAQIVAGSLPLGLLLVLIPTKIFATSVTLGSGGTFAPSLFLGAALGTIFGNFAHAFFPTFTAPAGAYALVGMGAVLAGVIHAPITSIFMLFEITGNYEIILPLMVACSVSTLFCRIILGDSIWAIRLAKRGIAPRHRREDLVLRSYRAEDIMRRDVRAVPPQTPIGDLLTIFLDCQESEIFVADGSGKYVGVIPLPDLKDLMSVQGAHDLAVAVDLVRTNGSRVSPKASLSECMDLFLKAETDSLPVVEEETQRLMGTISRRYLLDFYNREVLRTDYLGTIAEESASGPASRGTVQLPPGQQMAVLTVPPFLIGKTLREVDLRARYGVVVASVRPADSPARNELPDPARPFAPRDVLVLVGPNEAIEKFKAENAGG
ncbi:MAG: chloride channel protein [Bdellovibrionota bacterium]